MILKGFELSSLQNLRPRGVGDPRPGEGREAPAAAGPAEVCARELEGALVGTVPKPVEPVSGPVEPVSKAEKQVLNILK
jgi:hypothetical protein